MTYNQRLIEYEKEKRRLQNQCLSYKEYEAELMKLIKKWKI